MNLLNILKKETSKEVKSNIQKIDKNQLNKIIGGADTKAIIPGGGPIIVGGSTASGS